jgi:hypothetical protein
MPKAPVYKQGHAHARKNQVGAARQVATMQPETKAHRVNQPANFQLWSGIQTFDCAHVTRPLFARENIH